MQFIDTHSHLYASEFAEDLQEVLTNSANLGVNKVVLPNIDSASWPLLEEIVTKNPKQLFPSIGLHPCSVKENYLEELAHLKKYLPNKNNVAVGEIGIDLYWDKSYLEQQKDAFRIQCNWAKEYDLPIIIHVRNAFAEVFELMDELNDENLRGVFHCFSGTPSDIDKVCSYRDFYFGIGGVITFKKGGLAEVAHLIPTDKLLLETDSPYLAPTPHRGKRNSTEYIPLIAQKLAESTGHTLEQIAEITTANAEHLFNLS